ncbi:hypothetical protein V2J09_011186 [Rumex salicifolius]
MGQLYGVQNSEICFSKNLSEGKRQEIAGFLGVKEVDRYPKYLGLPTIIGRSKKVVFEGVKERMWKKPHG